MFTALYLKKTFKRTHRLRRIFFFWFQNTSLIYKRNNNLFKLYCNKYFSFLINTLSLKCRPYVAVTVIIPFGILSELQSYHDYVTLMNLNNRWTSYSIKGDIARKLYQLSNCWEWVRLEYMNVGQQRCTVYLHLPASGAVKAPECFIISISRICYDMIMYDYMAQTCVPLRYV